MQPPPAGSFLKTTVNNGIECDMRKRCECVYAREDPRFEIGIRERSTEVCFLVVTVSAVRESKTSRRTR